MNCQYDSLFVRTRNQESPVQRAEVEKPIFIYNLLIYLVYTKSLLSVYSFTFLNEVNYTR